MQDREGGRVSGRGGGCPRRRERGLRVRGAAVRGTFRGAGLSGALRGEGDGPHSLSFPARRRGQEAGQGPVSCVGACDSEHPATGDRDRPPRSGVTRCAACLDAAHADTPPEPPPPLAKPPPTRILPPGCVSTAPLP